MFGEFIFEFICDEEEVCNVGEQVVVIKEIFVKFNCYIDVLINYFIDGIFVVLSEKLEKCFEVFGCDVMYIKKFKILWVFKYFIVYFVCFFWKCDMQKKVKIMCKVIFLKEFDIVEFCFDDLCKVFVFVCDKVCEVCKDEEDIECVCKCCKKVYDKDIGDIVGGVGLFLE